MTNTKKNPIKTEDSDQLALEKFTSVVMERVIKELSPKIIQVGDEIRKEFREEIQDIRSKLNESIAVTKKTPNDLNSLFNSQQFQELAKKIPEMIGQGGLPSGGGQVGAPDSLQQQNPLGSLQGLFQMIKMLEGQPQGQGMGSFLNEMMIRNFYADMQFNQTLKKHLLTQALKMNPSDLEQFREVQDHLMNPLNNIAKPQPEDKKE